MTEHLLWPTPAQRSVSALELEERVARQEQAENTKLEHFRASLKAAGEPIEALKRAELELKLAQGELRKAESELGRANQEKAESHFEKFTLQRRVEVLRQESGQSQETQRNRMKKRIDFLSSKLQTLDQESKEKRNLCKEKKEYVSMCEKAQLYAQEALFKVRSVMISPKELLSFFEVELSSAHASWVENAKPGLWKSKVNKALERVEVLCEGFEAGIYTLGKDSGVLGGRERSVTDAVYAALLADSEKGALSFFERLLPFEPVGLEIDDVFCLRCLGLYLRSEKAELLSLLEDEVYAFGQRKAWGEAFKGLVTKDKALLERGLKAMLKLDADFFRQGAVEKQGLGLVNLRAAGIAYLALKTKMEVTIRASTFPWSLIEP